MSRETTATEDLLKFQISLLRLVTREESTRPAEHAAVTSQTRQLEAMVASLRHGRD